jgi:hypothetical protein
MVGPRYETIAVPFEIRDGRRVLTRQQVEELPYLRDFIRRFPTCFELDPVADIWIFKEQDDGPNPLT